MTLAPLYALIRRFEGLRLKPYLCPALVPTIGYGATVYPDGRKVTLKDPPITKDEAETLLEHDAMVYVRAALKLSPILATSTYRLCAIADFCYNLGVGRYKASTLKRCVDRGEWERAQEELNKWVYGGGRKLPGLVLRRAAEAVLIENGG